MLRFIQEVNTTTRSCALWDLEEETDYIVHVQSISMFGTSPMSEPLRFRTPKEAETQASKSKGNVERAGSNPTSSQQHVHQKPCGAASRLGSLTKSRVILSKDSE